MLVDILLKIAEPTTKRGNLVWTEGEGARRRAANEPFGRWRVHVKRLLQQRSHFRKFPRRFRQLFDRRPADLVGYQGIGGDESASARNSKRHLRQFLGKHKEFAIELLRFLGGDADGARRFARGGIAAFPQVLVP